MAALLWATVVDARDCDTDVSGNVVPFLVYCMFSVEFASLLPPRVSATLKGVSGLVFFLRLLLAPAASRRVRALSGAILVQGLACHGGLFRGACTLDLVLNFLYVSWVNATTTSVLVVPVATLVALLAFAHKRTTRMMERSELHWAFHAALVQFPLSVALAHSGV